MKPARRSPEGNRYAPSNVTSALMLGDRRKGRQGQGGLPAFATGHEITIRRKSLCLLRKIRTRCACGGRPSEIPDRSSPAKGRAKSLPPFIPERESLRRP